MYTFAELEKLPFHEFVNPVSLLQFLQDHSMSTAHFFVSAKAAKKIQESLDAIPGRFDFGPVPKALKMVGVKFMLKGMPIWELSEEFSTVNHLSVFKAIPQDQLKSFREAFGRLIYSDPKLGYAAVVSPSSKVTGYFIGPVATRVATPGNRALSIDNALSEEEMEQIKKIFGQGAQGEVTVGKVVPKEPEVEFVSTKTYHHNVGLSCAFRQWRATHSHCHYVHGYSVSVAFKFGCRELDEKNWVADFGGLKELKQFLEDTFDHKTIVAADDPELEWFKEGQRRGVLDLVVLEKGVGCERFAEYAFNAAQRIIASKYGERVWVEECEVREHEGNSAICRRKR